MASIGFGLNSNINSAQSLLAQRTFAQTQQALAQSLNRLATGQRINTGADDPAGLISSEHLRAELASLDAASRNALRTQSALRVADGALAEAGDLAGRLEGLAVRAANAGALSPGERQAIQIEADSVIEGINRVAAAASFAGEPVFATSDAAGDGARSFVFGVDVGDTVEVDLSTVRAEKLGVFADDNGQTRSLADVRAGEALNLVSGDVAGAQQAIKGAVADLAMRRGSLGAVEANQLRPMIGAIGAAFENIARANSIIRDTDFASETARLARLQTLSISGAGAIGLTTGVSADSLIGLLG